MVSRLREPIRGRYALLKNENLTHTYFSLLPPLSLQMLAAGPSPSRQEIARVSSGETVQPMRKDKTILKSVLQHQLNQLTLQ